MSGAVRVALGGASLSLPETRKLLQLFQVQIGYCAVSHPVLAPTYFVVAIRSVGLCVIRRNSRPREHVNYMLAPLVDQRRYSAAGNIFNPRADERKPIGPEISYVRSKIDLAVEPWLHIVLVR